MNWWRAHHGIATDPKYAVVQRYIALQGVTCVTRAEIVSVWVWLLDFCSQNEDRGSIDGVDIAQLSVTLDIPDERVAVILSALENTGMISSNRLKAWDKRQPKREDNSNERVKKYRNEVKRNVTQSNAVTPPRGRARDLISSVSVDRENSIAIESNSPPTPSNGKVSDDQLQEISDAFDRHMCHHNLQPRDLVIQQVLSMNGKFTWEKFRSNHQQYCDYWSQKGWNFCKVTFLGWVNAGMPPAPGLNAGPPIQMPPRGPCGKCGKDPCECHRAKHAKMMEDLDRAKAARV